jgi:hypothetical protein
MRWKMVEECRDGEWKMDKRWKMEDDGDRIEGGRREKE